MAITPVALIRLILRDAGVNGVGQTPKAEDNNDVFTTINQMMAEWSAKRWLVYHLVNVSTATTGAQSYTVGPGGDFNTARPDQIEAAFFRSTSNAPQPVDYPLTPIFAREDYNRIPVKNVGTWPDCFFYDSGWPLGTFYPYPIPSSGIGLLFLSLKATIAEFADLTTPIDLPPTYANAIRWNAAVRIRPMYQLPEDQSLIRLATQSLAVIRGQNTQLPHMQMPTGIPLQGGRYNIYSDTGGRR